MKKFLIISVTLIFGFALAAIASDLVIESKTQSYSETDNKIKMQGDVHVSIDDAHVVGDKADVTVTADNKLDTATFYDKPYAFQIKGKKKSEVKANILRVSLINKVVTAEGNAQATVLDGKNPVVVITSEVQEYDTNTNVMTATGSVIMRYKDIETFSNKAVIRVSKGGELQRLDLIGGAKVKQEKQHVSADHLIYSPQTGELIGIGHVSSDATMEDGSNLLLKSSYQQYNQKSNTFTGSGDVKIWFKDYYAQGPKVSFYPDKKTNKPNEIYFTGRSSVTQDIKTIEADKIKLILRPKNFYADGNVKTTIRDISNAKNAGEDGLF